MPTGYAERGAVEADRVADVSSPPYTPQTRHTVSKQSDVVGLNASECMVHLDANRFGILKSNGSNDVQNTFFFLHAIRIFSFPTNLPRFWPILRRPGRTCSRRCPPRSYRSRPEVVAEPILTHSTEKLGVKEQDFKNCARKCSARLLRIVLLQSTIVGNAFNIIHRTLISASDQNEALG